MSASRLVITAWPIPAEASTTTDSVVAARMAQRGRFRRTGGRAGRRCGGRGRVAEGRGGVAGMGGHLREEQPNEGS
ncbi:hypothetical protein TUSST3_31530 [Streptomyces sp. TUS-ST3]|nr:hypothetical protein TUSST3_31530 [Streptomyces sp. TUS-ST3]